MSTRAGLLTALGVLLAVGVALGAMMAAARSAGPRCVTATFAPASSAFERRWNAEHPGGRC